MGTVAANASVIIEFDESKHEYLINGQIVPSVTQILRAAGLIDDQWFTDESCIRGSYVAKATHYYDQGDLAVETVDPIIKPYLDAWIRFREESKIEVLASEERVYHSIYRYAGTLDRRARWRGKEMIIDIKTGAESDWHELQTAGYAMTFNRSIATGAVYLKNDGAYRFVQHDLVRPRDVFLAAIIISNWRNARKW